MTNNARSDDIAERIRIVAKCHDPGLVCKGSPKSHIKDPIPAVRVLPGTSSAAIEAMNHDDAVHVPQLPGYTEKTGENGLNDYVFWRVTHHHTFVVVLKNINLQCQQQSAHYRNVPGLPFTLAAKIIYCVPGHKLVRN